MSDDAATVDVIFGRRVREVRELAGMTQKQLAERMTLAGYRMPHSSISRIESGDRSVSVGEAVHLANFLGVPLAELITDVNADSEAERAHRRRVEAQIARRRLEYEAAERFRQAEEASALLNAAMARAGMPGRYDLRLCDERK